MRVLTLTQPWATLVAIGAKKIETRSWATKYRGPLLIHAAKGLASVIEREIESVFEFRSGVFYIALERAGYTEVPQLPRGAIVARCELRDVRIIGRELNGDATIAADDMLTRTPILGNEYAFGDYTPGRYAWLLSDVQALPTPIPAKGQLGLWRWEGDLT